MAGFHWAALFIWLGLAAGLEASSEESRKRHASIEADTGLQEELQYRAARSAGTDTWHSYGAELLRVADHYAPPAYQLQQAESAQSVIAHRVHNMMANLHRMRAERRAKMEAAASAFKESQEALREAKQAEQDVAEADKALTEVEEETQEAVVDTREVRDDLQEMSSEQIDAQKHMEKAEKLVEDDPDAGKVYAPAPTPSAAGQEGSESKVGDAEQADSESSGVKGVHVAVKERGRVKSHSVGEYQENDTPEREGATGWLWSSWSALGPLWLRKLMGCVIFGALLCGCCVGCFACWRMESSYKKANELNTAASGVIARQHAQQRAMERGDARYRSHSRGEDVSLSSTPRGGASASGRSYRSAPLQGPPSQGPSSRPASVPASPGLVLRGSSTPVYPAAGGRPIQPTHSYGSSAPLQATHSYGGSSAEGPRVSSRGGGCKSPTPVAG